MKNNKNKQKKYKLSCSESSKEQKGCHDHPSYKTSLSTIIDIKEVVDVRKASYSRDKCYAPEELQSECSGEKTIKAHSISKSSNLKSIEDGNHVYGFKGGPSEFNPKEKNLKVKKIGINNASIFSAFCANHDNQLFIPIDNGIKLVDEHIFLNHYRAIVREMYLKESISKLFNNSILTQIIKEKQLDFIDFVQSFIKDTEQGLKDLKSLKKNMDQKLVAKQYDTMMYYALIINSRIEVMSSGVWLPFKDIENKDLMELGNLSKSYNSISVSTLTFEDNKSIVLFSWFKELECPECLKFVQSFINLDKKEQSKAILYWLFAVNENIFFSPKWWESLNKDDQDILEELFNNTLFRNYKFQEYKKLNDLVDWKIVDIHTNIKMKD